MPKLSPPFRMESAEKNKIGRYADSAEDEIHLRKKKRQNDHSILDQPVRFTLLFCKIWTYFCPSTGSALIIIHDSCKDEKCMRIVKRKAPWHGLDRTAHEYPSNYDYYTPKKCSGWNQQVRNGKVVLICCGNQGSPPLFILRGDTCTQRQKLPHPFHVCLL